MESERGENVEYFWMLRKLLLVRFCFVLWVFFSVFSTFLYDVIQWFHLSVAPRNY